MIPPEIILDRLVRTQLRHEKGFENYIGKLDLESVESLSFRSLLSLVQDTMNEALRSEGVNASGGVEHPPFHFDYLKVQGGVKNAHAFQYGSFAFIVVTLPLVELLWNLSYRLSTLPRFWQILKLSRAELKMEELTGLLFQIQLIFLISHEYTHHVHEHCVESKSATNGLWNEFWSEAAEGTIQSQAQELVADGYAISLGLNYLLREERRRSALALLCHANASNLEGDEILLSCFFVALMAFLCELWRGGTDVTSLDTLTHPPPPVRIKYAVQVAEMWSSQNESLPRSWFEPARFQELFSVAADVIDSSAKGGWDPDRILA
jgi:hypothetical protein